MPEPTVEPHADADRRHCLRRMAHDPRGSRYGAGAMSFDFSTLFWIFIVVMALQPILMGRWYALQRAQAIRGIEKAHGTRVITMIHRQEKRSLLGLSVARYIDMEDAQTIIAAIKETPADVPIDLIIH